MKKNLSTLFFVGSALFASQALTAQNQVWPNAADATQVSASQFDAGLAGWTANSLFDGANTTGGNALWIHTATNESQGGYWGTNSTPMASPSAANGSVIFDSDYLDNGGVQGAFGLGPSASPHSGEIVSPSMDLSSSAQTGFIVEFFTSCRFFGGDQAQNHNMAVSVDGGTTWTAFPFEPATDPYEGLFTIDISSVTSTAASLADVKVKFTFATDYYYWMIDDVRVIEKPAYDLEVTAGAKVSRARYTPLAQVDQDIFSGLVEFNNLGGNDQIAPTVDSVKAVMDIYSVDASGAESLVHTSDTVRIDSVMANNADEYLLYFPAQFAPSVEGTYRAEYNVIGLDDLPATSTTTSNTFAVVSDDNGLMSKARLSTTTGELLANAGYRATVAAASTDQHGYGTVFYVKDAMTASGTARTIDSVAYSIGISAANGTTVLATDQAVAVYVYKWDDANGDFYFGASNDTWNTATTGNEMTLVGFGTDIVNNTNHPGSGLDTRGVQVVDPNTGAPVELESNTVYFVAFKTTDQNFYFGYDDAYEDDYLLSRVIANQFWDAANPASAKSPILQSCLLGNNNDNDDFEYYGNTIATTIGMYISNSGSSTTQSVTAANGITTTPNPATDLVQFSLEGNAENISYSITDLQGRVLAVETRTNVSNDVFEYNVSALAAGMYLITIETENGKNVSNFIVK